MKRLLPFAAAFATAATLACGGALAAEAERNPSADALPGVDGAAVTRSVGNPAPEPEDALPAGSQPGSIRVGDWDVTISGSISYQIGFGGRRDGR